MAVHQTCSGPEMESRGEKQITGQKPALLLAYFLVAEHPGSGKF